MRQGSPASRSRAACSVSKPRGFDLRRHVGEAEAHRLMLDQRLAEAGALPGVGERSFVGSPHGAGGLGRDADAAAFEVAERDGIAFAGLAQHEVGGEAHVLEDDLAGIVGALAHLGLVARDRVALGIRGHEEAADALLAGVGVGHGEDHRDIRPGAAGDELLGAAEAIAVAVRHCAGAQVRRVRARLRLGEAEAAQHVAAREGAEEAFLLLFGAAPEYAGADQRVVDAHRRGRADIARRDLLHGERVGHVVGTRPVPFRRHQHPHEPEPAHAGEDVVRVAAVQVPIARVRRELALGEVARHVADHALLVGEEDAVRCHGLVLRAARRRRPPARTRRR